MLPAMLIGEMAEGEIVVWPHVADFRRIRQELLRRGLFETDMRYYYKMAAWHALLWLSALYLSLCFESTAAHMLGASVMGLFWQQLAGIGHDLGHSGVTHDFYRDHVLGSILSAFMGLSVPTRPRPRPRPRPRCHCDRCPHTATVAPSPAPTPLPRWAGGSRTTTRTTSCAMQSSTTPTYCTYP